MTTPHHKSTLNTRQMDRQRRASYASLESTTLSPSVSAMTALFSELPMIWLMIWYVLRNLVTFDFAQYRNCVIEKTQTFQSQPNISYSTHTQNISKSSFHFLSAQLNIYTNFKTVNHIFFSCCMVAFNKKKMQSKVIHQVGH